VATTPDYAILAAPRISREGFIRVLTDARSPAASIAGEAWDAAVAAGVDPAVLLAVFRKESSYGKAGRAVRNRSWGNIKGQPADEAGFRVYPDWLTGAKDTIRLLGVYGRNAIRPGVKTDTVQTMPYVWAPGPGADLYGDQLAQWVTEWARRYPTTAGAQPTVTLAASDLLDEWLAQIGRQRTDPVRQEDVIPFVQWLQSKQLLPGGGATNPIVGSAIEDLKAAARRGASWEQAAAPYVAGQRRGIALDLEGAADVVRYALLGVLVVAIVILGLYLVARS
jgi:hypothetical protein